MVASGKEDTGCEIYAFFFFYLFLFPSLLRTRDGIEASLVARWCDQRLCLYWYLAAHTDKCI